MLRVLAYLLACSFSIASAFAWERVADSTALQPRDTAHGIVFNNRLWVSNGWTHSGVPFRDLWSSRDGVQWQLEVAATPYDAYSGLAVHNGAIFAANRSVWRSVDGRTWQKIGVTPLTRESSLPFLQSFNGKLYLFVVEGVWRSDDGTTWEEVPTPETLKRGSYAIAQFKGALWIMGGGKRLTASPPEVGDPEKTSFNDVWRFTEADGWIQVTASAPWSARLWPTAIVHGDRMFLVAGFDNRGNANLDETWVTSDGENWDRVERATRFTPRHWPTLFSTGEHILMVAGNGYPVLNDVWRLHVD